MNPLLTLFQITGDPQIDDEESVGSDVSFGPRTQEMRCPGCGRPGIRQITDWNGSANIIGKGGKFYPDQIAGLDYLISDRMRCDLLQSGLTGFVAHPIKIRNIASPVLAKMAPPRYYLLEVSGSVDIDRQLFDEYDGTLCEICHNWSPRPGGKYNYGTKIHVPILETWDGSDLVRIRNKRNASIYCSRKVVDLAIKKKWTGFGIQAFTDGLPRIDLTKSNWIDDLAVAVAKRFPGIS